MDFSLSFFSSLDDETSVDKYQLVIESAKYADEHGFSALWIPERHFQPFGGLFPNPSVLAGALATITKRIRLRSGSVVPSLHHPLRIVEEWSMVDNLSGGRVELSFASGWNVEDFIFAPEHYTDRKEEMYRRIAACQRLWRGEVYSTINPVGNKAEVHVFPRPVQRELPTWVTVARDPNTYVRAGEIGAGILTHLLSQSMDELTENVAAYYAARKRSGHPPATGRICVLVHAFLGDNLAVVKEKVREPFSNYLTSSASLIKAYASGVGRQNDAARISPELLKELTSHLFERHFKSTTLMGTPESVAWLVEQLEEIGVTELGCLVDFGVDTASTLESLPYLNELRQRYQ